MRFMLIPPARCLISHAVQFCVPGSPTEALIRKTAIMETYRVRSISAVIAAICLFASPAAACICVSPPLKQAFRRSDAIFVGRVVSVERDGLAVLEAGRWLKGEPSSLVSVWTPWNDGDCGYGSRFSVGSEHLVFANLENGQLQTSTCARTKPVEAAACDLDVIERRRWWWKTPLSSFTPIYWLSLAGLPASQVCSARPRGAE